MTAGDLSNEAMTRSLSWIMDHPNPMTDAIPADLRELWLKAAERALAKPLGTDIFTGEQRGQPLTFVVEIEPRSD